jgi:2-dehydro-3-deoxygalactonokinase
MPQPTTPPHAIVLDWGTTNFRALLVEAGGSVIDRIETQEGIQAVPQGGFEAVLARAIAPWRRAHGLLPVYAAGMIGSRNGWLELPYVETPAGIAELARAARHMKLQDGGGILFVPGLTDRAVKPFPDVMRGEETQLVGLGLGHDLTAVLPGTHSKWARIEGGRIVRFRTLVTGELFGVLSQHAFIARGAKPRAETDWQAFARGLDAAREHGVSAGLLSSLFSVRTGWLAGMLKPEEMSDYLSGLVIGAELREALDLGLARASEAVVILGGELNVERYRRAALAFGLEARPGPADVAVRGCLAVAGVATEMAKKR